MQTGAASIIAVLFLLSVVVTVVLLSLRHSGSEVAATKQHADALSALAVAESALERTAYRYRLTACAALPEGPSNFANGQYEIVSAILATGVCTVRIVAKVNLAARTIEAGLSQNSSDVAWAVGRNGRIFRRNAGTWSSVASGTNEDLLDVHCVSGNDCWAVGENGVLLHWNGSSWINNRFNGQKFNSVSCVPGQSNACWIAGDAFIRYWNGSNWNTQYNTSDEVLALDCPSTICYAVGKGGLVRRYTGAAWVAETSPLNWELTGVDCVSPSQCWATTRKNNNIFNLIWRNGASPWTRVQIPNSAAEDLNTISCADATHCFAAGDRGRLVSYNGTTWAYAGALGNQDVYGIDCRSSDQHCIAVGRNASVKYWSGSAWATESVPTSGTLYAVVFSDSGSSGVTIGAWREIVG